MVVDDFITHEPLNPTGCGFGKCAGWGRVDCSGRNDGTGYGYGYGDGDSTDAGCGTGYGRGNGSGFGSSFCAGGNRV